ncbi:MAG: ferritin [Azonexus sp.]|nr:ferritin [Azonexus sp.]MCK6411005.1 ferritin [Azonexus sp.]
MANHDESILRGQRLQPAAPFPLPYQALRIALYHEYAARAFHRQVTEAFGAQPPFADVLRTREQRIAALSELCQRYGVPRPLDPFPAETTISPGWRDNLQRALAGEAAGIRLYRYLAQQVVARDIQKTLLRLQTASLDHLPAFEQALQSAQARERYHAERGIPASQAYVKHGPLTDLLERGFSLLARQHGALGLVGSLVRATHPATLAGIVAGGAAVHYLRKRDHTSQPLEE